MKSLLTLLLVSSNHELDFKKMHMKTKIFTLAILVLLVACSKQADNTPNLPPTANAATLIAQTSFTANWSAPTGATGYFLDVATDAAFTSFVPGFKDLSVASTSLSVTGLTPGTNYFYRVRAKYAGGTSGNSSTIPAVTRQPGVWFFGDSITLGLEASTPNNRWTSVLCRIKNWQEINHGTSYQTLLKASENTGVPAFFEKYQSLIQTRGADDKYMFISYGGNDCAFNFPDYTTALFSTQLQTIITFANSKGWTNNSIVVLCGYFENDASWPANYNGTGNPAATMTRYFSFITAAQTVANNNAGVYFVNPFNSYDATGLADGLHPNDAGYAAIANYVDSLIP
jgi:lysophospholipase L1-like esterase